MAIHLLKNINFHFTLFRTAVHDFRYSVSVNSSASSGRLTAYLCHPERVPALSLC